MLSSTSAVLQGPTSAHQGGPEEAGAQPLSQAALGPVRRPHGHPEGLPVDRICCLSVQRVCMCRGASPVVPGRATPLHVCVCVCLSVRTSLLELSVHVQVWGVVVMPSLRAGASVQS